MDPGVISTLLVLGILVIIANLFCLIIIGITPSIRRPSVIAVGSLLFTHLLQGLFVIPSYMAKRSSVQDKTAKKVICDVFRFSYMITNYASCLTLLVISIDRLIAAYKPLNYTRIVTKRRMFGALVGTWIYVIILCCLPFGNMKPRSKCNYNIKKRWTIGMLLGNTFFPCLIITGCYIYVFKVARNVIRRRLSTKRLHATVDGKLRRRNSLREISAAKMSLIIVIAYYLCWGPSFFYYLLRSLCPSCFSKDFDDSQVEQILGFIMKTLTFADGLVAPCVYCYKHSGFRLALKRLRASLQRKKLAKKILYSDPAGTSSESAV